MVTAAPGAPAVITAQVVVLRGAVVPIVLPLAGLPPALRLALVESHPEVGIEARVGAALAAGQPEIAWRDLAGEAQPLSALGHCDDLLTRWAGDEAARVGLPAGRTGVLVVGAPATGRPQEASSGALGVVQELLASWPWPRWYGPVVVVVDAAPGGAGDATSASATDGAVWSPLRPNGTLDANGPPLVASAALLASFPGDATMVARPALPLVRVSGAGDLRGACAGAFAELALATGAPPPGGWPAWFTRGVVDLAAAKGRDQFVSPRHQQELRAAAGTAGLAALFADRHPDPGLSVAVVAFLLHPTRRKHLESFCALLRQGASTAGALRVAYGVELADVISQR